MQTISFSWVCALGVTLVLVLHSAAHAQTASKPVTTTATANDETAILEMHDRFTAAWSSAAIDKLLPLFTSDARRVGAAGDVQQTPAELRATFDRMLNGPFKGAKVSVERGTVRLLTPELALWEAPMTIELGGGKPPMRGHVHDVMKKVGGTWLILETHPKLFPPPPPK
jgi:uncharacterized protein (TIGR02246 family)